MKKIYSLVVVTLLVFTTTAFSQNYSLYGTTYNYGSGGSGTVFKLDLSKDSISAPVNFNGTNGSQPFYGPLTLDSASALLYGTTTYGGANGYGTLYSYGSCSGIKNLVNFKNNTPNGNTFTGKLAYDKTNGLFYGVAGSGGNFDDGVLFSLNPATSVYTKIIDFNGTNGANPVGGLTWNPHTNLFYGVTSGGGTANNGVLYSFDPTTNTETPLYTFNATNDGQQPGASLTYNPIDQNLYSTTEYNTSSGDGSLYFFNTTTNTDSIVIWFNGSTSGYRPQSTVLFNPLDSMLYGMVTYGGANSNGTIYSYNPKNGHDSVLVSFNGTNGAYPSNAFIYNPNDSLLYAQISSGGVNNYGVIISFNPRNSHDSVLYTLGNGNDAAGPFGDLLLDTAKNIFYGLTSNGGINNVGALYKFNLAKDTDTVLVNFNDTNGAYPYGNLVMLNGLLYSSTNNSLLLGSTSGPGLIFSYNIATGQDSVLYALQLNANESYPGNSGLTWVPSMKLYFGLTSGGGTSSAGTIYSFDPNTGKDSVCVSLDENSGYNPYSHFTYCPVNGLYFATTINGGANSSGTIISFNPATGKDSVWANFNGPTGSYARASLTFCPSNNMLYGTAYSGGANGNGAIYSLDPVAGTYTDIFDFNSATSGGAPGGTLTYDTAKGLLYGTTLGGGPSGAGTLFSIDPATGKDSTLYNFNVSTEGNQSTGAVTVDPTGNFLYGTVGYNGIYGNGTIFMFNLSTGKDSVIYAFDAAGTYGGNPYGDLLLVKNTVPAVTISNDTTICAGSIVNLSAGGPAGYIYSWSTGATTSSVSVSPTTTTTYSVGVCHGIYGKDTTVMVTVNPTPTVTVAGMDTIASGSMDTLVATGAVSYVWTSSGGTKDSAIVSPGATTTYTVTGTGANGCTDTASFRVVVKIITGIQNITQDAASVYPNPAKETMYLSFSMKGSADAVIQIVNMNGEQVMSKNATINNGEVMPVDIGSLAPGVYFAHITAGKQIETVRFVKE